MRRLIFLVLLCMPMALAAQQADTSRLLWAFPITSYIVPLGDTMKVVQVELPPYLQFVKGSQLGLVRGIARGKDIDTGSKGYGKCHLVKGAYYYFSLYLKSTSPPRAGDLLYTFIPRPKGIANTELLQCAAHAIVFTDVSDSALYSPMLMLKKWDMVADNDIVDKMRNDIHKVGNYYLEAGDTTLNMTLDEGGYKGKKLMDAMVAATSNDVRDFLRFVAVIPRQYAGNRWKVAETYATWLMHGAPIVIKQ